MNPPTAIIISPRKNYWLKYQPPNNQTLECNVSTCGRGAFSGAQALLTSSEDVIAGLLVSMHEAKRVRDMREYPFWARGANYLK